jgi:hypothetical protein
VRVQWMAQILRLGMEYITPLDSAEFIDTWVIIYFLVVLLL